MSRPDDPSHPDRPSHGTETMSFGRGTGAADPESTTVPDARAATPISEVDAWYDEPDGDAAGDAGPSTSEPSWLSSRWSSWTALDRDRRTIIVLIAVALVALVVALLGVTTRPDSTAVQLPAVESHGLDPDQAACLAYGLIEQRFGVRLGSDGFDAVDPSEISGELSQEIQALDDLAPNHPEADYQLITAFAAVADAGTALGDVDGFAGYQTAVAERADAVEAAARACDEVAGFDVDELEPR